MDTNTEQNLEDFITLAEASKQTGYHQDYLGFLCRTGKLKGFKIGRNWVTTKKDLDWFLANYKNGISEVVDETGIKIPVHVSHLETDEQAAYNKESRLDNNLNFEEVIARPEFTASENLETAAPTADVLVQNDKHDSLSFLKKEVLESIEQRVKNLNESIKGIEVKIQEQNSSMPVVAPTAPVPAMAERGRLSAAEQQKELKNKFASTIVLQRDSELSELPKVSGGGLVPDTFNKESVKKLFASFKQARGSAFRPLFVTAVTAVALLGLFGYFALALLSGDLNQQANETKIVYQKSADQAADLKDQRGSGNAVIGNVTVNRTVNQLLGFSDADIYNLIDNRLSQYLAEGKFKGEKGDQGLQGVPGLQNNISYIPSNPVNGYSGGSMAGVTYLSAQDFITNNATINNSLVSNGSASFNGATDLNGATTISDLSVGSVNLGFVQGSVVFQGSTGLAQDNNNLFYSASTTQLAIGTNTPSSTLTVAGTMNVTGLSTLGTTTISMLSADTFNGQIITPGSGTLTLNDNALVVQGGNSSFIGTNNIISSAVSTSTISQITLNGNGNVLDVLGASAIDQFVTTTSTPTFAGLVLNGSSSALSLIITGNATTTGQQAVGGDLTVAGNGYFTGSLDIGDNLQVSGGSIVIGNSTTSPADLLQVMGNIQIGSVSTTTAYGLLFNDGAAHQIKLIASSSTASSYTLTLPTTTPVANNLMMTDANGSLSWVAPTALGLQPAGDYVTNTYASSTFPSFTYASTTFVSFDYASSTFQTALVNPVTGTGVANQLAYWNSSNQITGLATGTANTFLRASSTSATGFDWAAVNGLAPSGTPGNIQFAGTGNTLNANQLFNWDNTNLKLSIGTTSTSSTLTLQATAGTSPLTIVSSSGTSFLAIDKNNNFIQGGGSVNSSSINSVALGGATVTSSNVSGSNFSIGWSGTDVSAGYNSLAMAGGVISGNGAYNIAIGKGAKTTGSYTSSIALGTGDTSGGVSTALTNFGSDIAIGSYITANANNAYIFGSGPSGNNRLINGVSRSILLGMNTTAPTLFVGGGYTTTTSGSVAIGTTTNSSMFTIQGIATTTLPIFTIASNTGTTLLTVLPSGNVGIGTTSPQALLSVQGTSGNLLQAWNGATSEMSVTSAGVLTTNSNALFNGSVSIGTTTAPGVKLDVYNSSAANDSPTISFRIYTGATDPTLGVLRFSIGQNTSATSTSRYTYLSSGDSVSMRPIVLNYNGGGSYGNNAIGTTTAGSRLTIQGSDTSSSNSSLNIMDSTGSSIFFVRNDGNVGIGTTSPAQLLHIAGAGSQSLRIDRTSVGKWDLGIGQIMNGSTGGDFIFTPQTAASGMVFQVSPDGGGQTRAMGIDKNGNVGIGTTSPADLLQVMGNIQIGSVSTTTAYGLLFNDGAAHQIKLIASSSTASSYTLTLPTTAPVASNLMTTDANGNLSWVAPTALGLQPAGDYVTNTYASSTFPSFTYASSTFVSFGYATSTFQTILTNPVTGTGVVNQLAYWSGTGQITGLATGTPNTFLRASSTSATGFDWAAVNGLAPSGTPGNIQFYSDATHLNASSLFNWDNANLKLSIGTTSTTSTLTLQATAGQSALTIASSSGTTLLTVAANGNVGIGTDSPKAKLEVSGGILSQGTTGDTPVSGAGTRFMWIPAKGSLRAGAVTNTQWDDANIGINSVALGYADTASGDQSTALGYNNTASGNYSIAIGYGNTADSAGAIALGYNNSSLRGSAVTLGRANSNSGIASVILGGYDGVANTITTAGNYSVAMGRNLTISAAGVFGVGLDGNPYTLNTPNTMAIMGGNVGIGITSPADLLQVMGNIQIGSVSTTTAYGLLFNDGSAHQIKLIASSSTASSYTLTLPATAPVAGNAMLTDANGNLYWGTAGSSSQWVTSGSSIYYNLGNVAIGTTSATSLLTLQATSASASLLTIASTSGASLLNVSWYGGLTQNISSTTAVNIQDGSGNSVFAIDTTQSANNSGIDITAGGSQTGNLLNFFSSGGTQLLSITPVGGLVQNISSTTAVSVLNGSGVNVFNIDTLNQRIRLATTTAPTLTQDGEFAIGDNSATTTTSGRIWIRSNGVTYNFQSVGNTADYSEYFYQLNSTSTEPGTIMAVDNSTSSPVFGTGLARIATGSYNSLILGVITTQGTSYNNPDDKRNLNPNFVNVGLLGHVTVKVATTTAPIKAGDFLTSSADQPGKAMKATHSGMVVGVALADYDPSINTSTNPTIMSLVKPGFEIINNTFVLGENDGQLASQINADPSGQINTDATTAPISFLIDQKGSGDILQLQQNEQDRFLVASSGTVSILASAASDTDNILTVRNGTNALFTISAVGDITTVGHITVGKDTAGTATITKGNNQVTVRFDTPYIVAPKVVATVNGLADFFYGVTGKDQNGFTITTSKPVEADMSFDWIALAQPQDTTYQSSLDTSIQVVHAPTGSGTTITTPSGGATTTETTDTSSGGAGTTGSGGDNTTGTETTVTDTGTRNAGTGSESTSGSGATANTGTGEGGQVRILR